MTHGKGNRRRTRQTATALEHAQLRGFGIDGNP
jgi:hypothetical protein